ncbi:hypothetical protein QTP88_019939 [Uroleucon formosanum]
MLYKQLTDSSLVDALNCFEMHGFAGQICYAVLCVFSYIAAGHKRTIGQTYKDKTQRKLSTHSPESSENKC